MELLAKNNELIFCEKKAFDLLTIVSAIGVFFILLNANSGFGPGKLHDGLTNTKSFFLRFVEG